VARLIGEHRPTVGRAKAPSLIPGNSVGFLRNRADWRSVALASPPNQGGEAVIFITTYKLKPFMSKAELRELMGVFAEVGADPAVTAHYVAADGGHGVLISETDDPEPGYRTLQHYRQWIEYDSKPMMTIEQAAPIIMEALS
jgi:hypothetical protein